MINLTKILLILAVLVTSMTSISLAQSEEQKVQLYVSMYKDDAIENQIKFGVPAAITLAQALHESGIGSSYLAIYGNNHFGIKCGSKWTGPTIRKDDDKPDECFRRYESPKESYNDHSLFLVTNGRYSSLFRIDPKDYKSWAYGLKSAGYATNPQYAQKLIEAVEKYNLNKYSIQAEEQSNEEVANIEKTNELPPTNNNAANQNNTPAESNQVAELPIEQVLIGGALAPPTIRWDSMVRYKGLQAFYAPPGLSLVLVSQEFQIPLSKLLLYNDLESDIIPEKSIMFLEAKRRRGLDQYAYVEKSMDMWQISQKSAVSLSEICALNRVSPGDYPLPGERIFLQKFNPDRIKLDPSPFTTSSSDLPITVDPNAPQKPDRSISSTVNRVINFGSQPPPPKPIKEERKEDKPIYRDQEDIVEVITKEVEPQVIIVDKPNVTEPDEEVVVINDELIPVEDEYEDDDPVVAQWETNEDVETINSVINGKSSGDDDPEIIDFDQTVHLVTPGQNLNMISVLYRVDKADIMQVNNMTSEKIYEGQQIIIPSQSFNLNENSDLSEDTEIEDITKNNDNEYLPTSDSSNPSEDNTSDGMKTYTVQNGDNLYQIARKNGVTVEDIITANHKSDGFVYVGEKLIIPEGKASNNSPNNRPIDNTITELKHYVKKGETLFSISQQYGVSVNDVMSWNGLSSNNIYIGQALKILQ